MIITNNTFTGNRVKGKSSDNSTNIYNIALSKEKTRKSEQHAKPGISEVPTFHKAKPDFAKIPSDIRATLERMCAAAYHKLTLSQKTILEKANQYGMSYQLDISESEGWNKFTDAVYRWEDLLEAAEELNISWDESNYDPVGLKQAIEEDEIKNLQKQKLFYSGFFATTGVGGKVS